jgi:hypothetical protein
MFYSLHPQGTPGKNSLNYPRHTMRVRRALYMRHFLSRQNSCRWLFLMILLINYLCMQNKPGECAREMIITRQESESAPFALHFAGDTSCAGDVGASNRRWNCNPCFCVYRPTTPGSGVLMAAHNHPARERDKIRGWVIRIICLALANLWVAGGRADFD